MPPYKASLLKKQNASSIDYMGKYLTDLIPCYFFYAYQCNIQALILAGHIGLFPHFKEKWPIAILSGNSPLYNVKA